MRKEFESQFRDKGDDLWNFDEPLGTVELYGQPFVARMRIHLSQEPYREYRDLVPLTTTRGRRDYVLMRPYILIPDISLQADLFRRPSDGRTRGQVVSSESKGMRHERIGDGQAWFYQEDRTIVLWEAMLLERHRQGSPDQDRNLHALWRGFENVLRHSFPAAHRIVTPRDEPEYDSAQWHQFLERLGYRQLDEQMYGKEVGAAS